MTMQPKRGHSNRRAFLLGMTLNELAFLLFFLLVLISTHLLQSRSDQLLEKTAQLQQLESQLSKKQVILDETFRKLGLVQNTVDRLQELQPNVKPGELEQQFKRLVDSESKARSDRQTLQNRLDEVNTILRTGDLQTQKALSESTLGAVQKLIAENNAMQSQIDKYEFQLKSIQNRAGGSGLDHLPCWFDPNTGAIEYLFRITILENFLKIDPVWPAHRTKTAKKLPSVSLLSNRTVSTHEFLQKAKTLLDWSRHQKPECRHFVRIRDHKNTSKKAFKQQMLAVEAIFYKYLEPE